MADQDISLGGLTLSSTALGTGLVNPGLRIDSKLIDGGKVAYLRLFSIRFNGSVRLFTTATASGTDFGTEGPNLTTTWEDSSKAVTLQRTTATGVKSSRTLSGPGSLDRTEPYDWFVPVAERTGLEAWLRAHAAGDTYVLTLDDDFSIAPVVGSAAPVTLAYQIPSVTGSSLPPVVGNAEPVTLSFQIPDVTGRELPVVTGRASPVTLAFEIPSVTGASVEPTVLPSADLHIPSGVSDEFLISIRNPRTFEVINTVPIEAVKRMEYVTRWLELGRAELLLSAQNLDPESRVYEDLRDGGIIDLIRFWVDPTTGKRRSERWWGPSQRVELRTQNGSVRRIRGAEIINEVIVLGDERAECRPVARVGNPLLQSLYGVREIKPNGVGLVSQRQLSSIADLEAYGAAKIEEYSRTIYDGRGDWTNPGETTVIRVIAEDAWSYAAARVVATDRAAFVFAGGRSASGYIANLLDSELINPGRTLSYRAAPAGVRVANPGLGRRIPRTVRWEPLMEAIKVAALYGDIGLQYSFDPITLELTLTTAEGRNLTIGDDSVTLTSHEVGDVDIQPGDTVLVALDHDITAFPTTTAVPVLGRAVTISPGKQTDVSLEWGNVRFRIAEKDALLLDFSRDTVVE